MKKLYYISLLLLIFLHTGNLYSQSSWFWLNPYPQGNTLYEVKMFDANNGISFNYDNILLTSNSGENWSLNYTGFLSNNKFLSIVDRNKWYILLSSGEIIITTNGGFSWTSVSSVNMDYLTLFQFISENSGFTISRFNNNYSGGTKLSRTSNGGINWFISFSDTNFSLADMHFPSMSTGYAVGKKALDIDYHLKILKTINGGISWDSLQNNITLDGQKLFFVNDNTGFIAGSISGVGKIYKTTNGGLNYTLLNNNFGQNIFDIYFADTMHGYVQYYAYQYYTSDGGTTWLNLGSVGNSSNFIYSIYFNDIFTGYCVGTGGKIFKTTNSGMNWIMKSYGYYGFLDGVSFININTGLVVSDGGSLLRTSNGGLNWNTINLGQNLWGLSSVSKVGTNIFYVSEYWDGKLYKSTDTGITWDTLYTNGSSFIDLDFVNENTGFGICKYGEFLKTTNAGLNWHETLPFIPQDIFYKIDFVNENTGYVGGDNFYRTTNGGNSWDTITKPYGAYTTSIQFVNQNFGFAVCYRNQNLSYILKTSNAGLNWFAYSIANYRMWDIFMINENYGYSVGYDGKIIKTNDGWNHWYELKSCSYNSNYAVFFIDSLTGYVVGSDGAIIKTTNGGGGPIGIQPVSGIVPEKIFLHHNYPNPFNPITKIKFDIPKQSEVKIIVYDLLGREVSTLVNEQLKAGTYEVEWDGSFYSSGVYFYTIEADNFAETKKMVFIK
jgi:photosystem II stability/assembly factor-like uncharacterized protein